MNYLAIFSFIRALFKYEIVFDPTKWKNRTLLAEALTALFLAVMAVFPNTGLTTADAAIIAGFCALVMSMISNIVTTRKVGLDPKGRFKKVYEKVKEPPNDDYLVPDIDGVRVPSSTQTNDPPLQGEAESNSVNDGGKGLLGGH